MGSPRATPESPRASDAAVYAKGAELMQVVLSDQSINREEYQYDESWENIKKIISQHEREDELSYTVRFGDNHVEKISFDTVIATEGGQEALARYEAGENSLSEATESSEHEVIMSKRRNRRKPASLADYVDTIDAISDDDAPSLRRSRRTTRNSMTLRLNFSLDSLSSESEAESEPSGPPNRRQTRQSMRSREQKRSGTLRRGSHFAEDSEEESSEDSELRILESDLVPSQRKRKSNRLQIQRDHKRVKAAKVATRRSERSTRTHNNMEEVEIDNIYRSDTSTDRAPAQPRIALVRENFKPGLPNSLFRRRHNENCESCGKPSICGLLVCCQGCSLAYHKACLGNRSTRDHLVTKVGEEDFVLQCRRCVNMAQKKDHLAPHLGRCQACRDFGTSCEPFRRRKTAAQEQKDREENGGLDPVTDISPDLINNANNLLFRCVKCWRGFHFYCLPNRDQYHMDLETATVAEVAENRYNQYRSDWFCKDCSDMPADVGGLVAWRPTDNIETSESTGLFYDAFEEEDKEYLIKWKELSYARSVFMPGAWVWGITAPAMRKAFSKKENGPKMRIEEAIPEEFLRIDIVLDVEYTNRIDIQTEEVDKVRIKEVKRVFIKYKGLGYEDAVWEVPPTPLEEERWVDFVSAYNDWVLGRYIHQPKGAPLRVRIEKVRNQEFKKLEKKQQPENVTGGEMMKYQMDGLNWLYYQWYQKKNGILADEMGLGKTIQVIAFLAMMVADHNCYPFLVVVPNSTCANWRREIKKWAPGLRVVTFFGSKTARDIAYQYEMFPRGTKELKAHVVVTSYDAAADDSCRKFFKDVQWQGLIVDEGQRLKNEKSILHLALKSLKIPYRILLSGTPLQNNAKELFNLLEFLDDNIDAEQMERDYAAMTETNIRKLHDTIRPFILRRTKAQVLTFLPPMAQIILPVSMSVVQKKVYMSILAKNPELLKALFSRGNEVAKNDLGSLNNILMQLRKCLCHPFVYSRDIEERKLNPSLLHRNLVDASAKLQLLDVLLPKLKERGHRVLIFSQFLDMLDIVEDFLDGLGMKFNRLDGRISSLEKQKRIDQFNHEGSELFAMLLSTRAGGVGINLATADTVIILDPDFNPHQDIQAISRAHRIGQQKKVLCFQLMTRNSAEEKIMQIGRKKMALDHVVVEQLDADEADDKDLESILRHGAAELFEDSEEHNIKYDGASVEKLLDRSKIEKTKIGDDNSAESQFSLARVWANEQGALEENFNTVDEVAPDPTVWDRILKDRERAAAAEAAAMAQLLGRGRRARHDVHYGDDHGAVNGDVDMGDALTGTITPVKFVNKRRVGDDSDTDFQPEDREDSADEADELHAIEPSEMTPDKPALPPSGLARAHIVPSSAAKPPTQKPLQPPRQTPVKLKAKPFKRAQVLPARLPPAPSTIRTSANGRNERRNPDEIGPPDSPYGPPPPIVRCPACGKTHYQGSCPLKVAGVEYCNLCGLAHYSSSTGGFSRTCPHFNSETQVIIMLEELKTSREPPHLREMASKYLRGVKGTIVQAKRKAMDKADPVSRNSAQNPKITTAKNGMHQGEGGSDSALKPSYGNGNAKTQPSVTSRNGSSRNNGPSNQHQNKQIGNSGGQDVETRLLAALGSSI